MSPTTGTWPGPWRVPPDRGHAAETRDPERVVPLPHGTPTRFRGPANEGAATGFTVLDAPALRGPRLSAHLAGPGRSRVCTAHVGVGWALARLPRPRAASVPRRGSSRRRSTGARSRTAEPAPTMEVRPVG
ncbi:DUF1702 family protein [Nocardiopsis sp. NPDC050513]|uniref:DUF1702 family protein n=1 Tax=Nocardiopsis sp. NPDC050513 TaxID=3364338 RepID=UPI0037BD4136